MIQSFHRFLIDHLSSEGNSFPHNPSIFQHPPSHTASTAFQADTHPNPNASFSPAAAPVTQLLGIDAKNIIVCLSCKTVREKENMTHVVDMIYPRKVRLFPSCAGHFLPSSTSSHFRMNFRLKLPLLIFSARH